jgi:hypothetical protein
VISVDLAAAVGAALADRGAGWTPRSGDRFIFTERDLDQVFVVSEMVIEVADLPSGRLIRFNGTTEWALDSTPAEDVVWLPREEQLRAALGETFLALARVVDGWAVTLTDGSRHVAEDPEDAYALAVLG